LEELLSLLQKKDESTFPNKELTYVNSGTSDEERLIKVGAALLTPQQEMCKNNFIEHHKNFSSL